MHTHSSPTCPQCGIVIPDEAAGRLCPRCVFAKALAPTADGTFVPHSPPGLDEVRAAFPHLEVIGLIGSGGMGAVFKARQPQLDRFVALKILPAELAGQSGFSERFQREAQALARLSHPNIVSVHDFGQAGGFYHLLMEFVDGVNLRQLLQTKKLTPKEALSIVPPVCDALQCAHDHGIVHRDIKPENLLIDKKGGVKIADFGIAKIVARESDPGAGDEETRADSRTTALGTPDYAAPEQQNGTADHRADIYSLGVVLYEMLTGERPKEKLEAPSKRVQVDVRIDEIVLRALEKTPELRFATAAEFRTQVEAATAEHRDQAPPPLTTDASRQHASIPRSIWIILLLAFPVITLLGMTLLLASGGVSGRELLAIAAAAVIPGLVVPAIILAFARRSGFAFGQPGRAAPSQQPVQSICSTTTRTAWLLPMTALVLVCTGTMMMAVGAYAAKNGAMVAGALLPVVAWIISGWRLLREPRHGALGPVARAVFSVIVALGLVRLLSLSGSFWLPVAKNALGQSSLITLMAVHQSFSQIVWALEVGAVFGLYVWTQRRIQGAATKMTARLTAGCFVLLAVYFMAPWLVVVSAKLTASPTTLTNSASADQRKPTPTIQTLDARLQRIAEQAMQDAGVMQGAFAAINPDSGEVVALVSLPSSTTETGGVGRFVVVPQPAHELFQPVTALAGLMVGRGKDVFACNPISPEARVGGVRYWGQTMGCDTSHSSMSAHGQLTLEQALRKSCDSYFYQFGNATGYPELLSMANTLGLQHKTDALGGNINPALPDLKTFQDRFHSEREATLQTAEIASGRAAFMSPLQAAVVHSAIANGKVWTPRLVKNAAATPRTDFSSVSVMKDGLQQIRQALKHVVNDPDGRARAAMSPQVVIAGMASALGGVSKEPDPKSLTDRSWFAGFAPFDQPKLAFALFVQKRAPGSRVGIDGTGPVIRRIVEEALSMSAIDEPAQTAKAIDEETVTEATQPAPTIAPEAITTLDPHLEEIAIRAMLDANVGTGAFAAVDPESGRVLALVSLSPSFLEKYEAAKRNGPDPKLPGKAGVRGAFRSAPLFEIFQPVTALAAVLSGRSKDKHTCEIMGSDDGTTYGGFRIGGNARFFCRSSFAAKAACGELDLSQALMRGCSSYFCYALAVSGYPKLQVTAEQLGLQNETNILGGKAYPVLPPEPTREPDSRDDGSPLLKKAMIADGQFCQGSPLQMALVYSVLANGKVWQPLIDRESIPVVTLDYNERSRMGLDVIREALKRMVNNPEGRAYAAHSSRQIIAGSSATVVLNPRGGSKDRDLTKNVRYDWFAGFAPFDNPKLAFALFVEQRGAPDGLKFDGCGPVIRRIVEEAQSEREVTPYETKDRQTVPRIPAKPLAAAVKPRADNQPIEIPFKGEPKITLPGESAPVTESPKVAATQEPEKTNSYHEITRAARKEHRQKLATLLLEADHAEILLLDFDIVANKQRSRLGARQSGLDLIPGSKFPIYPMGTTANVLDRKMLTKEQLAPLLPRLAAAVRTEEGGHDWCHFPVHGLRLYRGKEEIFESSFCWVCSTFTLLYPDHSDLHAVRDEELQRLMEQWMPIPAKELERLKAKRPNLFVFRAPEEVMTQVRNDLAALMELPSSFGRGPGDVEKALSDLHAEIARKPKAFEYSREELAAFRKDECPFSDADMEEAFVRLQAAVNGRPLPGLPAFYRAKLTAGSLTPKQKTISYRMVSSLLAEVEDRTAESSTTGTAGNSSQGSLQLRWIRDTPSAETEPMLLAGRGQKQTLNVDKTILLDETALQTVEAIHGDGGSKIALQLTESGKQRFAELTREGKGRRLAIIIDGRVHAAPMIMAEIRDGRVEISGTLTGEEADDLAARLQTALEHKHERLKQPAQGGPEKNPPAASTSPASKAPSGEDHVFAEPLHQALRVASKDAVPHFQFAAGKTFLIRTPSAASQDEIKADWDKANAGGGVDFSISEEAGDILIHPRGCLFGKWMDGMAAYSSSASQTMTLGATLGASTEPIRLVRGQWPVSCVFRTARGLIGWMTVSSVNHVADKADRLFFEYRLVKKLGGTPQTVSEFYQKANQRWDQRDYKGAVTVYDEAIKQHTAESGLFNNRANAHAALENYDKALADYAEALRLAPGHSNIHRARSLAYVQMGDYDRAISDLDIAVKASPEGVNFDLRGRAYHAKGDYQAALADYEKGVQATPGYTFTLMDLAWLLATCPDQEIRDGQKASQYASLAAAALQTSHAEVLVAQAAARAEERDFAGAIQLEQSFLKTLPTDSAEAAKSRERLKLYQAHQPLRSPMPLFRSLWR